MAVTIKQVMDLTGAKFFTPKTPKDWKFSFRVLAVSREQFDRHFIGSVGGLGLSSMFTPTTKPEYIDGKIVGFLEVHDGRFGITVIEKKSDGKDLGTIVWED